MSKTNQITFILLGITGFLFLSNLSPPINVDKDAWIIAVLLLLMTFWWMTETIPLSITALLPLIIVPTSSNFSIVEVVKPYSNPVIFLLLGGFIIGLGFQKSNLHLRFAMYILNLIGFSKKGLLGGIIISTSILSMWLSNTATCLLMLPIVMSILNKIHGEDDYHIKIILLSIAYSASIGGMTTLIGTAPNALFAAFMSENYQINISFINWIVFTFPLVFVLLIIFWYVSTYLIKKSKFKSIEKKALKKQLENLGKISSKEKITMFILILTISLWINKKLLNDYLGINLTDSNIALFGSLLFFIIPDPKFNFILNKDWYRSIPWNILLLFGGGLSLANLITSSGLADWASDLMYIISDLNIFMIIICIAFLISLMTEVTSNTATTLLFLPILAKFGSNYNIDIFMVTLPIILAASSAFMMPIATPPNAIIFSTNKIKISFMVKIGFFMNIFAVTLSSVWIYFFKDLIR